MVARMLQLKKFNCCLTFLSLLAATCLYSAEDPVDMSGSFEGWRQLGSANWRIEGEEFVADSGSGHLVTQESYTDFRISAEFWTSEGANSGIFYRISDPDNIADTNAYEANIFDTRPDQTYRTGGVVRFAAPAVVIDTGNRWNSYEISMRGDHMVVVLNGVTTVDIRDTTYGSGPISLQYGSGLVKFRNLQIQRL
jgi:hypothetical protein